MKPTHSLPQQYLAASDSIDWQHPLVHETARELAIGCRDDAEIAGCCFEFVRDRVLHSWDHQIDRVTLSASQVLEHRTGFCYAKSHLLAALLRANGIPAGICYQRLRMGASTRPFGLHALNAVYLEPHGWYRVDARGIKPGCDAAFTPPIECLPYPADKPGEANLPEIWIDPIAPVVAALSRYQSILDLRNNLPDIEIAIW